MSTTVVQDRTPKPGRAGATISRVIIYTLLALFALVYLTPLFVMLVTSFKTMAEIQDGDLLSLPRSPTFAPWLRAWSETCVGHYDPPATASAAISGTPSRWWFRPCSSPPCWGRSTATC